MATRARRRVLIGATLLVLALFILGSAPKGNAQSGCQYCCEDPCTAGVMSVQAQCGSNSPSCNGSVTFNVPNDGIYGTPFYWVQEIYDCCGIVFCSDDWPAQQCGGGVAKSRQWRPQADYTRLAADFGEYLRVCSGRYELREPDFALAFYVPRSKSAARIRAKAKISEKSHGRRLIAQARQGR